MGRGRAHDIEEDLSGVSPEAFVNGCLPTTDTSCQYRHCNDSRLHLHMLVASGAELGLESCGRGNEETHDEMESGAMHTRYNERERTKQSM